MGFSLGDLNPVKAIDNALVGLDKSVKDVGGWKVVAPLTAAVAAPFVYPYLAGTTAGGFGLTASQVPNLGASLGATGGATAATGATGFGLTAPAAGYTFGELGASQVPTLTGNLGLTGAATAGLTGLQKAMLIRSGINALSQMTGGTHGGGYAPMSSGNAMTAYQRQNPYLSTAQQNTVPDSTTAALTKLLRGYNG